MEKLRLTVSDFIALTNQTLEYAYPSIEIEGEVASFKVNQGKYVFFDLKDSGGTVGCFMMVFQLRVPIEDGMKVIVSASPKLTQRGKFSLTVKAIRPSGEGSLKKSFELLKEKLAKEGLFAADRKRLLPDIPQHVAVISSTQAAGYADFVKILNDRWGGMQVDVAHVAVQGSAAPEQIIRALKYFNQQETLPEVIVIIRGGGSADDLAAFNDEPLVRAVAASRVPTLTGIGHEVDESLVDLAADIRAATPSNAAQLLVPDRHDYIRSVRRQVVGLSSVMLGRLEDGRREVTGLFERADDLINKKLQTTATLVDSLGQTLVQLDPSVAMRRGYAIVRGQTTPGSSIEIELKDAIIQAEVTKNDKK